jgi:hypothetical protein
MAAALTNFDYRAALLALLSAFLRLTPAGNNPLVTMRRRCEAGNGMQKLSSLLAEQRQQRLPQLDCA